MGLGAFVFPEEVDSRISVIRISPLMAVKSPSKLRIGHHLTKVSSGTSVNEDTGTSVLPVCQVEYVVR